MAWRCCALIVQRIVFTNAYGSDSRGQRGRTIVLHSAESATRVAIDVRAPPALAKPIFQGLPSEFLAQLKSGKDS